MNILFLTDGITPYVTGGMQKHSLILVKLLLKKGIQITLVHCGYTNQAEFSTDYKAIFSEIELKNLTIKFVPFLNKGRYPGHYIYENKVYSKRIYELFKNQLNKFDIVYAQGFTGWAFVKQTMKPKVLVNFHGFEMFQKAASLKVKFEHLLLRPFVKLICKKSDFVYSFGGQIDQILLKIGIPQSKILDQSNGIELKWIKDSFQNHKPLNFVFIGRNERRKGIEELTKSLIKLKEQNQINFNFTFIGPIEPNQTIVSNQIKYLGEIKSQTKIHQILSSSDVLVCPSYAEGMPTVILEAMANGLAIITTDVGASSKMINGNGIVLKNVEPQSISQAIINLNSISNSDLEDMKKSSLSLVKSKFIWEQVADDIIKDLKRIK